MVTLGTCWFVAIDRILQSGVQSRVKDYCFAGKATPKSRRGVARQVVDTLRLSDAAVSLLLLPFGVDACRLERSQINLLKLE
jgi:hypothetical protein